jgi:hypothetical protein
VKSCKSSRIFFEKDSAQIGEKFLYTFPGFCGILLGQVPGGGLTRANQNLYFRRRFSGKSDSGLPFRTGGCLLCCGLFAAETLKGVKNWQKN